MGEMADHYRDQEMDDEAGYEASFTGITRASKWKTRDKRMIKIRDMDDSHLAHCVNFLDGNGSVPAVGHPSVLAAWKAAMLREIRGRQSGRLKQGEVTDARPRR